MSGSFDIAKRRTLEAADLSRKGSIDEHIVELVNLINNNAAFVTTSSCSGRVVLFEGNDEGQHVKKGCKWLLVSHDVVDVKQLQAALSCASDVAVLKYEPFVLHTQCRSLDDARNMHAAAVASGFRNSGITVGKTGKIITAVRSTHSLELPLTKDGRLIVSDEYLHFVTSLANRKHTENLARVHRFYDNLVHLMTKQAKQTFQSSGDLTGCEQTAREKGSANVREKPRPSMHGESDDDFDLSLLE